MINKNPMTRRNVTLALGTFALAHSGVIGASAQPAHVAKHIKLAPGEETLTAFMKLHTSLAEEDVYYWYSGTYDGNIIGKTLKPILGFESIIKRRVSIPKPGVYHVKTWEASYYHALNALSPIDSEFINPLDGNSIKPFHYKEGPTTFEYSSSAPRIVGSDISIAQEGQHFEMPWQMSGDSLWTQRETFIDIPHIWPEEERAVRPSEVSADRLRFSSISSHFGLMSEIMDDSLKRASSFFNYQATTDFLPWFKLSAEPGCMIWRANGAKISSLDEIPDEVIQGFQSIHPEIFDDVPWTKFRNLWEDYLAYFDE